MSIRSSPTADPFIDFAEFARSKVGKLDAIVLNAAETGLLWNTKERGDKIRSWIETNRALVLSLLPLLHDFDQKELRGRLLFVSSAQADSPRPGVEAYGQIKREAELFLDEMFRSEMGLKNVLPIIVRPGSVATSMHAEVLAHGPEPLREWRKSLAQQGRFRSPEVLGRCIAGIALTGALYNPASQAWDLPLPRLERVNLSDTLYSALASAKDEMELSMPRFHVPMETALSRSVP
jgi:NAD(P)-dependent dehydrogenase (short-subunit alcohol dehydrogenase family)